MPDYQQWFEDVYPQLTHSGLWLRGNELNTLARKEYGLRPFRVLFVRLSTYEDVASSFSHLLLYQIASGIQNIFPDLAYLPPENDAKIFSRDKIPWLLGTQTKFGPEKFSLIGFSNSIIQETLNIPKFLTTSNIPLKKSDRLKRHDLPLIILGGANALYTSSFWGNDSFVDGLFIGSDTFCVRKLLEICALGYKNKKLKALILEELTSVPGFYLPERQNAFPEKDIAKPHDIEIMENGIVSYNEAELGLSFLEISSGCRALCSFCAENWLRKPYRELDADVVLEKAKKMKARMGLENIALYSFNFNMHAQFYRLLWKLSEIFKNIGLKSQRFDTLAANPEMIEYQIIAGKTVFSCGLEGISSRLRKYLNKNLDAEFLIKSFELIFKFKARELKIFLLSTGLENEADFIQFNALLKTIKEIRQKFEAKTRVIFSITPLVKFPQTPLEFDKAYPKAAHDKIIASLQRLAAQHNFESRQAMDTKEYLISQILVRADNPKIKNALLDALFTTGFVYYRHISFEFFSAFLGNLKKEGLPLEELLNGYSFEKSQEKPWSNIKTGIARKFLWDTYNKNIKFAEIGISLDIVALEKPHFSVPEYKELMLKIKSDEARKSFLVSVNELGRGLLRKYLGIALARALMLADDSLTPYFRSYVRSHFSGEKIKPVWVIGADILVLSWDKKALPILEKNFSEPAFIALANKHLGKWAELKKMADEQTPLFKLRFDSPYEFNGADYFKKRGIKYTLYKEKPFSYSLKFTNDSLKKKIIAACSYTVNENLCAVNSFKISLGITPGMKFDAEEFIREAFTYPKKNDWVRILVTSSIC